MPYIETLVSDREVVAFLVDDPDLIVQAVDELIARSADIRKRPRGRNADWYDAERWRLVRESLPGAAPGDHAAIDALLDGFLRLDSLNRARAMERLQALTR